MSFICNSVELPSSESNHNFFGNTSENEHELSFNLSDNDDNVSETESLSNGNDFSENEPHYYSSSSNSDEENNDSSELEELYCEKENTIENAFQITGRRLINISYFLNQLKDLKHKGTIKVNYHLCNFFNAYYFLGFDCSFFDMHLISEKIEGMHSALSFKCAVCNITQVVRTEDPNDNKNSNLVAVLGAISTGIGYGQLSELFAAMDVPNMASKTYTKFHGQIASAVYDENEETMKAAIQFYNPIVKFGKAKEKRELQHQRLEKFVNYEKQHPQQKQSPRFYTRPSQVIVLPNSG